MSEQKFSINKIDNDIQLPWWSLLIGTGKRVNENPLDSEYNIFWDASTQNNGNQYSTNMLILGMSGSGKTCMVKNLISQLERKDVQVVVNTSPVNEYLNYMKDHNFSVVTSNDIDKTLDKISFIEFKAQSICNFMSEKGITKLNPSGKVDLGDSIVIDDCYIPSDSEFTVDGESFNISSVNLEDYVGKTLEVHAFNSIVEFDLESNNWQKGGSYKFKPVFLVLDDISFYLNDCCIPEIKEEFLLVINHILTIGYKVNVHVIASTIWVDSIISNDLKKYFDITCVCGATDRQYSMKAIGSYAANELPLEKGYCLVSECGVESIVRAPFNK